MSRAGLCANCGVRPTHPPHPYCGKACADAAAGGFGVGLPKMCLNCKDKAARTGFDFCGKACGQAYGGDKPRANSYDSWAQLPVSPIGGASRGFSPQPPGGWRTNNGIPRRPPPKRLCRNCNKYPAYKNEDYCSRKCDDEDQGPPDSPPPRRPGGGGGPRLDEEDDDDNDNNDDGGDHFSRLPGRGDDWGGLPDDRVTGGSARRPTSKRVERCLKCDQFDKEPGSDFCSKRCQADARAALSGGGGSRMSGVRGQYQLALAVPIPPARPAPPAVQKCQIPQCKKPVFAVGSKYCGNSHRELAVKMKLEHACLKCKKVPRTFRTHFCSTTCQQAAEAAAPMLLDLPDSDPKYADIKKQFEDSWNSAQTLAQYGLLSAAANGKPVVHRICKVINPKAIETRYQAYKNTVEGKRKFTRQGLLPGREENLWRGVTRTCTVGDSAANLTLCMTAGCGVCSTTRSGYTLQNNGYTNAVHAHGSSSTAHGYTSGNYRAVLLNRVVVGLQATYTGATVGGYVLPAGYDSLASDANRTTQWVYRVDAICPSWLVLYS